MSGTTTPVTDPNAASNQFNNDYNGYTDSNGVFHPGLVQDEQTKTEAEQKMKAQSAVVGSETGSAQVCGAIQLLIDMVDYVGDVYGVVGAQMTCVTDLSNEVSGIQDLSNTMTEEAQTLAGSPQGQALASAQAQYNAAVAAQTQLTAAEQGQGQAQQAYTNEYNLIYGSNGLQWQVQNDEFNINYYSKKKNSDPELVAYYTNQLNTVDQPALNAAMVQLGIDQTNLTDANTNLTNAQANAAKYPSVADAQTALTQAQTNYNAALASNPTLAAANTALQANAASMLTMLQDYSKDLNEASSFLPASTVTALQDNLNTIVGQLSGATPPDTNINNLTADQIANTYLTQFGQTSTSTVESTITGQLTASLSTLASVSKKQLLLEQYIASTDSQLISSSGAILSNVNKMNQFSVQHQTAG